MADAPPVNLSGLQYRYANPLQSSVVDAEKNVVEFVFASPEPVERYGYFPDSQIYGRFDEVLSMDKAHVVLDRVKNSVCMLLDNHRADQRVGKIVECTFDGESGKAKAKVGRSTFGQQYLNDIEDGTEPGKSFGYRVYKYEVVSSAKYEFDEDGYRKTIQKAVLKGVEWELFEVSLASVPADSSVGFTEYRKGEDLKEFALDMRSVLGNPGIEPTDLPIPKGEKMADVNEDKSPDLNELLGRVTVLETATAQKDSEIESLRKQVAERDRRLTVSEQYNSLRQAATGLTSELKMSKVEFEQLFRGDRASVDELLKSPNCEQHLFFLQETLAQAKGRSAGLPTGFRVNEQVEDSTQVGVTSTELSSRFGGLATAVSKSSVEADTQIREKAKEMGLDPNKTADYAKAMTAIGYNG